MWSKHFEAGAEPWSAHGAAERWLAEHGYSVGAMQGPAPRGILRGHYLIAKWRNLTREERLRLDGTMESNGRADAVVVKLKVAPEARAA